MAANYLKEKIQNLESSLAEAWEIIDDFTLILDANQLENESKFFTIYKRAMEWLMRHEDE